MLQPDLTPDCTACAALCCVGFALDKGDAFGIDKPAGVPCPNLAHHRCKIHSQLTSKGFSGCVAYNCIGAGQRTIALFDGQSWQDDPDLLPKQLDTFRHVHTIHSLSELLVAAGALPLPKALQTQRLNFLNELAPDGFTTQTATQIATGPLPHQIKTFLQSLASYAVKNPR